MEMAVESWRWLWGQFPVPAGCQNRYFCPLKLVFDGGGATELYLGKMLIPLGFSRWRLYIGGGAMSGGGPDGHTPWWRGLGVARATSRCGRPVVRLLLSFGLRLRVR
jgi:hypothetical protein